MRAIFSALVADALGSVMVLMTATIRRKSPPSADGGR